MKMIDKQKNIFSDDNLNENSPNIIMGINLFPDYKANYYINSNRSLENT